MAYETAHNIVTGILRIAPRSPKCQIKAAIDSMPENLRKGMPALGGEGAKPCRCAECSKP